MVSCHEFISTYSDYRDGLVGAGLARSLARHRNECPSCARYDRVIRRGVEVARNIDGPSPSREFLPRLQHRIYHLEDDFRPDPFGSGVSVALLLMISVVFGVSAWLPAVRAASEPARLPAITALAPLPEQAPPAEAFPAASISRPLAEAEVPRGLTNLDAAALGWTRSPFAAGTGEGLLIGYSPRP
ncbi:hypothetical protein BH23GEM4_BH23GEM4_24290 [soil metagenome]|jgi:hypothetical protein